MCLWVLVLYWQEISSHLPGIRATCAQDFREDVILLGGMV